MNRIEHGDFLQLARSLPVGQTGLVVADPPFNIGFLYGGHCTDNQTPQEYLQWTRLWLAACYRLLKPNGSIYVCQGDNYAAETKIALEETGFHFRNWIIWHYRFGENQRFKFSRCHTHILYYTKSHKQFVFNQSAIAVSSLRQTKYGDKRAADGGKTPDDVWEYPRVCGTFKERAGYTTQMPEAIIERCILASSNPGDLVVSPFSGTGTDAVVAARLGRRYWACDVSMKCVINSRRRIRDGLTKVKR